MRNARDGFVGGGNMLSRDQPARIWVVLYDGVEPIDLGGTLGVISMASRVLPGLSGTTIAEHAGPVRCAGGLTVLAAHGFGDLSAGGSRGASPVSAPGLFTGSFTGAFAGSSAGSSAGAHAQHAVCDAVVVAGGPGWLAQSQNAPMLAFLRGLDVGLLASVCTGALILGAAGLLDGCRATTRRTAIGAEVQPPLALLAQMGAQPRVAQIVDAGGPITGGGVALAHDLTLHLIGRLYGEAARDEVARLIEYDRAFAANRAALGIVVD
jgi:transcriptional regulator GlxA family with amidase domain